MLRDLTPFLSKVLTDHEQDLYRLGWVDMFDNDLGMTNEGRKRYIRCMALLDGDFIKYASKEVKKAIKAAKKEV